MPKLSECVWGSWRVILDGHGYELHRRAGYPPGPGKFGLLRPFAVQLRVWADGKPRTIATGKDDAAAWLHLVVGLMGNLTPSALPPIPGPGYEDGSRDPVKED